MHKRNLQARNITFKTENFKQGVAMHKTINRYVMSVQ